MIQCIAKTKYEGTSCWNRPEDERLECNLENHSSNSIHPQDGAEYPHHPKSKAGRRVPTVFEALDLSLADPDVPNIGILALHPDTMRRGQNWRQGSDV